MCFIFSILLLDDASLSSFNSEELRALNPDWLQKIGLQEKCKKWLVNSKLEGMYFGLLVVFRFCKQ